jgi:hypothetical protein
MFEDKTVTLTNLNKYLCTGKSKKKVNINNSSAKVFKKTHCDYR